jgi:Aminotransferase class-V
VRVSQETSTRDAEPHWLLIPQRVRRCGPRDEERMSCDRCSRTTYRKPPARVEAGTGNIADAAGLAAGLDYLSRLGMAILHRFGV